jgi:hypothetical protein
VTLPAVGVVVETCFVAKLTSLYDFGGLPLLLLLLLLGLLLLIIELLLGLLLLSLFPDTVAMEAVEVLEVAVAAVVV